MALENIPAYKCIPGTGFVVDGFRESYAGPNVKGYFLSHAHADHYAGLSETWDNGVIYCSEQTARLIQHMDQLRIKKDLVRPLPMDTPVTIDGVEVTLVDANHCPGAVQFLFQLPDGRKYIHCGDMRFGEHLMGNEHLQRFVGADGVFLDTTYCKAKHQFPPQDEAVEHVASTMERLMSEEVNLRRLYIIQTYGIGKERVFIEVARRCKCKLYCSDRKRTVMECLDMPGINKDDIFTSNPRETPVHIVVWGFLGEAFPFFKPNFTKMEEYGKDMGADEVIGWVPTGWTYENKRNMFPVKKKGHCSIHLVPYSEHSSYNELQTYVKFLRPHEVIPTVGVEGDDGDKKRLAILKHFSRLVDPLAKKAKFLSAFQKKPSWAAQDELPATASGSLKAAPSGAHAVEEAVHVKEEGGLHTGSGGHHESTEGLVKQEKDLSLADLKAEDVKVKAEAAEEEPAQNGAAQAEVYTDRPGNDKDPESEVDISTSDSDVKPEELQAVKDELADCLQDSAKAAADEDTDRSHLEESVQQLISILGTETSTLEARRLLFKAGGDIERALNLHYNDSEAEATGSAAEASVKSEPGSIQKESKGPSATQELPRSPSAPRKDSAPSARAGKQPAAKRRAGGSAAGKQKQPPAKKLKVEDPHQRSIASFLARPTSRTAAAGSAPVVKTEEDPQEVNNSDSAVKVEEQEDPLAGVDVEGQMKLERAIQRAAAARKQKQQHKAEEEAVTDPNEGGFVKQGQDPSEAAAALGASAMVVADLSDADILVDANPEAETADVRSRRSSNAQHNSAGHEAKSIAGALCTRLQGQQPAGDVAQVKAEHDSSGAEAPVKQEEAEAVLSDVSMDEAAEREAEEIADRISTDPAAIVKLEGMPDVKLEDPAAEKQLRQLGMFSSARSNTKGVANALIEKRKVRQRKAGLGTPEEKSLITNSAADAAGPAQPKSPAPAQQNGAAENGAVTWQDGKPAPYLLIARAFAAMEGTTKRLKKDEIMVDAYRAILQRCPEDLLPAAYLTCGKIAPEHEGVELNVGGSVISAAIREATGVTRQRLHAMYDSLGDPGDVAEACRHTQTMLIQPAPLTVRSVYKSLRSMAEQKGSGATARRKQTILSLLRSCRDCETRYLVRTLVSNLRVGANWRSVIGALARATLLHSEATRPNKLRLDAAATAAIEAFHVCPSLDILVPTLMQYGAEQLHEHIALTPGVPLKPMLAGITEGVPDALKQLGVEDGLPFLAEYKYDGIRAQIHLLRNGSVCVFSRNCEDRSQAFPDVATAIRTAAEGGCKEVVLDAELVAIDRGKANELKSFQELSTRARGAIAASEVKVPVCVFAFDCLCVDGETLLKEPLEVRRARMAAALPNMQPGFVCLAKSHRLQGSKPASAQGAQQGSSNGASSPAKAAGAEEVHTSTAGDAVTDLVSDDEAVDSDGKESAVEAAQQASLSTLEKQAPGPEDIAMADGEPAAIQPGGEVQEATIEALIREHLQDALAAGTEGLMLKALTGPTASYQPSKRSTHWLKIKRDYCEELRDSLDLVPIGAWHGNGRKVGWYSPFLLAAYDPDTEEFQSVCRCMSGYTDAFYAEATERFKQKVLPEKRAYYSTNERPDVWFEPNEVWEIRGADLTLSAVHKSAYGLLHPTRGVSLRFPRFIRLRDDKNADDASTPEVIGQLFNAQTRKLQIAKETVAKRDEKDIPVENKADAEGLEEALPAEEENE